MRAACLRQRHRPGQLHRALAQTCGHLRRGNARQRRNRAQIGKIGLQIALGHRPCPARAALKADLRGPCAQIQRRTANFAIQKILKAIDAALGGKILPVHLRGQIKAGRSGIAWQAGPRRDLR